MGIQFYWKHILHRDWDWINIVKPPVVRAIPDILTPSEIERLIGATRKLRYRVFLLVTYSMGLRLEEALSLPVCDKDIWFIFVVAKGPKIVWFLYLISPCRPYEYCG